MSYSDQSIDYIYFEKNGAIKFLKEIETKFGLYYQSQSPRLEKPAIPKLGSRNVSLYWHKQVGEFLAGFSKSNRGGEAYYDYPFVSDQLISDSKILYEISLFIRDKGDIIHVERGFYAIQFKRVAKIFDHLLVGMNVTDFALIKSKTEFEKEIGKVKIEKISAATTTKKLQNSNWWMFYFYEISLKNGVPGNKMKYGIQKDLLTIDEKQASIHQNLIPQRENRFEVSNGKYKVSQDGRYFESSFSNKRFNNYFRLTVDWGKEGVSSFGMGVYHTIRPNGSLLTGSLILVKENKSIDEISEDTRSMFYENGIGVDDILKLFFQRRAENLIKLPNVESFDLESLAEKMVNYKGLGGQKKDIRLYEYDVFIAIPLLSTNEGYYKRNHEIATVVKEALIKKLRLTKIYCAFENNATYESFDNIDPRVKYQKTFNALEASKYFLMIYPSLPKGSKPKISSAFTELGYAMGLGKKVIFLYDRNTPKEHLPGNLWAYKNLDAYDKFDAKNSTEQIISILTQNEESLFQEKI